MIFRPKLAVVGAIFFVVVAFFLSGSLLAVALVEMSTALSAVVSDADNTTFAVVDECSSAFTASSAQDAWVAISIAATRLDSEFSMYIERQAISLATIGHLLARLRIDITEPTGLRLAIEAITELFTAFPNEETPTVEVMTALPPLIWPDGHQTAVAHGPTLAKGFGALIQPSYPLRDQLGGFVRFRGPSRYLPTIVSNNNWTARNLSFPNEASLLNPRGEVYDTFFLRDASMGYLKDGACVLVPGLVRPTCPSANPPCTLTSDFVQCDGTIGNLLPREYVVAAPYLFLHVLSLPIDLRVVDPHITPTTKTSAETHGLGFGLGALPGGNPLGNCSVATPCVSEVAGSTFEITEVTYDDTWGYLRTYVDMEGMGPMLSSLAESISDESVAAEPPAGCPRLHARTAVVDARMQVVAASEGSVTSLDFVPQRVLLREMGTSRVRTQSQVLGDIGQALPATLQGENASYGDDYRAMVTCSCNETFLVRISQIRVNNAVCPRVAGRQCHAIMYLLVVVSEDVVQASARQAQSLLAVQNEESVSRMTDSIRSRVSRTSILVVGVAIAISVGVIALAALMQAAFARRVSAFAEVLEAASTLDAGEMLAALCHLGVKPEKAAVTTGKATSGGARMTGLEIPEDQRDVALRTFLGYFQQSKQAMFEVREIAALQRAFVALFTTVTSLGKYVPAEVIERYRGGAPAATLGMAPATVVVMFADVANFTTICERTSPERMLAVMSHFFGVMSDCVSFGGGAVDKFIGDCVMGVWGISGEGPHDPFSAVVTAVNMLCCVRSLGPLWARHLSFIGGFMLRIGLHRGAALAGNIGSSTRFNYTVIGDVVNAASRLEAGNKMFSTTLMMSESVLRSDEARLRATFPIRLLGAISLKGKTEVMRTYSIFRADDLFERVRVVAAEASSPTDAPEAPLEANVLPRDSPSKTNRVGAEGQGMPSRLDNAGARMVAESQQFVSPRVVESVSPESLPQPSVVGAAGTQTPDGESDASVSPSLSTVPRASVLTVDAAAGGPNHQLSVPVIRRGSSMIPRRAVENVHKLEAMMSTAPGPAGEASSAQTTSMPDRGNTSVVMEDLGSMSSLPFSSDPAGFSFTRSADVVESGAPNTGRQGAQDSTTAGTSLSTRRPPVEPLAINASSHGGRAAGTPNLSLQRTARTNPTTPGTNSPSAFVTFSAASRGKLVSPVSFDGSKSPARVRANTVSSHGVSSRSFMSGMSSGTLAIDMSRLALLDPARAAEDPQTVAALYAPEEMDYVQRYTAAVEAFILGDFRKVAAATRQLVGQFSEDSAALMLMRRADELVANPPVEWRGVMDQVGK
eukprot:TRINITY_DN12416_c0_g1_i1.p1 TRINITY_DN12416_c0_g1~~TRINITY_DN12416_c0_g1_i1.p1  ORF type:complete len:1320 (-),score=274.99 TRINITY_DN12416_c0_g1_i1:714-4673(-)